MAFRREVQAMDADLPIDGPNTLTTSLARNYRSNAFNGALFVAFAAVRSCWRPSVCMPSSPIR